MTMIYEQLTANSKISARRVSVLHRKEIDKDIHKDSESNTSLEVHRFIGLSLIANKSQGLVL